MTEPMLTRFTPGYVAEPVQAALNDETLQRIACYAAISTDEGHSYLPQTSGDAEQFRAHKWVIEAMREAARSAVTAALMGARVAPVASDVGDEALTTPLDGTVARPLAIYSAFRSAQEEQEPVDRMGLPLSCGRPLCAPGNHHPLCKLAPPSAPQPSPVTHGDAEDASDTALLNILADEYLDLRTFGMPTGQGDADVGWRVIQHHMGEPTERVVSEVYKDDPRSAIRAAIARLKRDPYCTSALHEEDADPAARSKEGGAA
jgi:hypothetical protein